MIITITNTTLNFILIKIVSSNCMIIIGKIVTQFAYETVCNSCNGLELGERRYKGSTKALEAMQANGDKLSNKIGRY